MLFDKKSKAFEQRRSCDRVLFVFNGYEVNTKLAKNGIHDKYKKSSCLLFVPGTETRWKATLRQGDPRDEFWH